MTNLADIASALGPPKETVRIGEADIEVQGLSARDLGSIVRRFPEFEALMGIAAPEEGEAGAKPEMLSAMMKMTTGAWPAIIACGVGQPGDEKTEETAAGFRMEVSAALITVIMRLTYPAAPARPSNGSALSAPGPSERGDAEAPAQPNNSPPP